MGVVWSHGIKCDKFTMKKLIDNENWFGATLIEYSNLSSPVTNDWNLSLRRSYGNTTVHSNNLKNILKKSTKCYGRISVQDNCIVFQGLDCVGLLRAIILRREQSPPAFEKSLSNSPTSLNHDSYSFNSLSSTSQSGHEVVDLPTVDKLNTFVWPMNSIRNFGHKNNFFSFDSGRFSPTGEGRFTFKIKNIAPFIGIFQKSYNQCSQITPEKFSPVSSISPYYNLKSSQSYRNISQIPTEPKLNDKSYRTRNKSIEFNFDIKNRNSNNDDSVFPINYSSIDFSHSYVNSHNMTTMKLSDGDNGHDLKKRVRDSIYYLTICENQTKAVEEVLKRIG